MTELIKALLETSLELNEQILGAFSVFLRVGGAMAFLPGVGESAIPVRIKLVITLSITILIIGQGTTNFQNEAAGLHLIRNVAIGLAIGLLFRVMIFSIEICGHIISNMASMAQVFPNGAEVSPAISILMKYTGILLLIKLGIVEKYCVSLTLSYDAAGRFKGTASADFFPLILSKTASSLDIAFRLSLPFIIFSILYNFLLGLMNRIMPALMVHLIFSPAMALCGITILFSIYTLIIIQWLLIVS